MVANVTSYWLQKCWRFNITHFLWIWFLFQATFPIKPCPLRGLYLGYRASSAMPTTPAFATPPLERPPGWWATSMTPCKYFRFWVCIGFYRLYMKVFLIYVSLSSFTASPDCSSMPRKFSSTANMTRALKVSKASSGPWENCRETLKVHHIQTPSISSTYTIVQKFWNEDFQDHQSCIYSIKNTVKSLIMWNIITNEKNW